MHIKVTVTSNMTTIPVYPGQDLSKTEGFPGTKRFVDCRTFHFKNSPKQNQDNLITLRYCMIDVKYMLF